MAATDSTDDEWLGKFEVALSARSNLKPRLTQNKWSNKVVRKLKRSGFDHWLQFKIPQAHL